MTRPSLPPPHAEASGIARRATSRGARAAALVCLAGAVSACGLLDSDDGAAAKGAGPSFTVAAAGDVLIHPELTAQAGKDAAAAGKKGLDFGPMMAAVKPVISKADLAICHMEPVLGKPEGPFETYPNFQAPPQIATTLKDIGYDTCSTASNHVLDHGVPGVVRTLNTLDAAGLKHTGSARSAAEEAKPLIVDVKGVKVAQLSFAGGFNGREVPEDKPWLANQTSFKQIAADERAARKAGADVVILSIHWGREHQPAPNAVQLKLGKRIAERTGINLVIGHHAHVVQPMEKVNNTWIAYGLGNQIARHEVPSGLSEEGAIGWFTFTKQGGEWDVRAEYLPTLVDIPPDPESPDAPKEPAAGAVVDYRLLNPAALLKDGGKGLSEQQAARYRLAFERTQGTMLNRGAANDGLKPLQAPSG